LPEKIVFGTDYPVRKRLDGLGAIKRLDVEDADNERVLW
jgi:predicted TIM-barrel fold metal-dependent hydrolase